MLLPDLPCQLGRATILSVASGNGRYSAFASCHGCKTRVSIPLD
jgi:hypothetical protein